MRPPSGWRSLLWSVKPLTLNHTLTRKSRMLHSVPPPEYHSPASSAPHPSSSP